MPRDIHERVECEDAQAASMLPAFQVPWLRVALAAVLLYMIGALIAPGVYLLFTRFLDEETAGRELSRLGTAGDMFGAANALFGGVALVLIIVSIRQQSADLQLQRADFQLQLREIRESTAAQRDLAANQQAARAAEIVLPLVNELRSYEFGRAIETCASFRRKHTPDQFVKMFVTLQKNYREGRASNQGRNEFELINHSRRTVVSLVHKVYRLKEAGILTEDRIARIVLTPDHVAFLIDTIRPLEMVIRPRPDGGDSHPPIDYARTLYSEAEIQANRY